MDSSHDSTLSRTLVTLGFQVYLYFSSLFWKGIYRSFITCVERNHGCKRTGLQRSYDEHLHPSRPPEGIESIQRHSHQQKNNSTEKIKKYPVHRVGVPPPYVQDSNLIWMDVKGLSGRNTHCSKNNSGSQITSPWEPGCHRDASLHVQYTCSPF